MLVKSHSRVKGPERLGRERRRQRQRIGITGGSALVRRFEVLQKHSGYDNGSKALRERIRERLGAEHLAGAEGRDFSATWTSVYHHRQRELAARMTERSQTITTSPLSGASIASACPSERTLWRLALAVDLGAVEAQGAEAAERILAGGLPRLDKDRFELLGEAPSEGREGVVVGVSVPKMRIILIDIGDGHARLAIRGTQAASRVLRNGGTRNGSEDHRTASDHPT